MYEKELIKKILEQPYQHEWSIQGLGMLRLYLSPELRLHIWDSRYRVENVSQMHTHPWDFTSLIVAGVVRNQIVVESEGSWEPTHYKQSIFCGVGGGLEGEPVRVRLVEDSYNTWREGQTYSEKAHQIHISDPEDGTVTLIKRHFLEDADHALVFWEEGEWVSAEPRRAELDEVQNITAYSLEKWF